MADYATYKDGIVYWNSYSWNYFEVAIRGPKPARAIAKIDSNNIVHFSIPIPGSLNDGRHKVSVSKEALEYSLAHYGELVYSRVPVAQNQHLRANFDLIVSKAIENDRSRQPILDQWEQDNPILSAGIMPDGSVRVFNENIDPDILKHYKGKVIATARMPERYGEPGENLGTIDTLEPGTAAILRRASDRPRTRQQVLAYEAEQELSRNIALTSLTAGIPLDDFFILSNASRTYRNWKAAELADDAYDTYRAASALGKIRRTGGSSDDLVEFRGMASDIYSDPITNRIYRRMDDQGLHMTIDFENSGRLYGEAHRDGFQINTRAFRVGDSTTVNEVVIHEASHLRDVLLGRQPIILGKPSNTIRSEYRALRNEAAYRLGRRPTLQERIDIIEDYQLWDTRMWNFEGDTTRLPNIHGGN